MAIKPPNHAKDAIPTVRGWEHPRTGELLIARRHTQSQIDEYFGLTPYEFSEPEAAPEPVATLSDNAHENDPDWHEGCHTEEEPDDLNTLNKKQLEEVGRDHGIELDRREKKSTLIEKLRAVISK